MKRIAFLFAMVVSGCLVSCTASLESPSKAFKLSNPSLVLSKNIFGAKASIPTDVNGKARVKYDKPSGSFEAEGEFSSSASGVVDAEARRAEVIMPLAMKNADNQTAINLASIQAQQAVWEKGFETIGSVGGAFLARPTGSSGSGSMGLLADVLPILTDAGIGPREIMAAMSSWPMMGDAPIAPQPGIPPQ